MHNVLLIVEYDGTAYHGFQTQPGLSTIQDELERAVFLITGERSRVSGAGRTDAGVHAVGQVVNFKSHSILAEQTLLRALNAVLPDDIAVKHCAVAGPEFHARFSAKSREYRYSIINREAPSALARAFAHHYRRRLDLDAMQDASCSLVGTRDYASFSRVGTTTTGTTRTVMSATWKREGDWLYFYIEANGFLPQMVRGIVGTLIWVGTGKIDARGFHEIMLARDRRLAGPTAPAKGLCFMSASY
ncbi:MAG: tRNA pseudouridine(38-40) synthase TruA [Chloroflexi bacterium]|nr:tRNA pseudouridine(38-40) synthase TruA [Chloroflexota bacterium]